MKEVLFVILNDYADWEAAPLAAAINQKEGFCVRTVSLTKKAVVSIGGFSVHPDYDLSEAANKDFAGLILIGGNSWRTEEAKQVRELVDLAIKKNAVVAAICDASVYLGAMGALNEVEHTSNQLQDLQSYAGENYTNESSYKHQQAVRSGNVVTANGTANLEFSKEVLLALDMMSNKEVEQWYSFFKLGYYEAIKNKA
ncbi:type 1 glutamine amidotransferase family protein [Aneurinibacillus sp. REN35]|uniref:type 1 glutamine amidotransferase family protein n=1 Tax=Aneurinibacillus sp. REN35 TaxID=3237286 RepID=UPI003527D2DF